MKKGLVIALVIVSFSAGFNVVALDVPASFKKDGHATVTCDEASTTTVFCRREGSLVPKWVCGMGKFEVINDSIYAAASQSCQLKAQSR